MSNVHPVIAAALEPYTPDRAMKATTVGVEGTFELWGKDWQFSALCSVWGSFRSWEFDGIDHLEVLPPGCGEWIKVDPNDMRRAELDQIENECAAQIEGGR